MTDFLQDIIIVRELAKHETLTVRNPKEIISINLPLPSCSDEYNAHCNIQVSHTEQYGINVTVLTLNYTGPVTTGDSCIYGGLVVNNADLRGDLFEQMLQCYSYSEIKYPSLLSALHAEHMWISVYSYNKYSSITVQLHLSGSLCKSIPLLATKKCLHNLNRDTFIAFAISIKYTRKNMTLNTTASSFEGDRYNEHPFGPGKTKYFRYGFQRYKNCISAKLGVPLRALPGNIDGYCLSL